MMKKGVEKKRGQVSIFIIIAIIIVAVIAIIFIVRGNNFGKEKVCGSFGFNRLRPFCQCFFNR